MSLTWAINRLLTPTFFAAAKKVAKKTLAPARAVENFRLYSAKIFAVAFGRCELSPLNTP